MDNAKPFCIPKRWVWKAYKRVKANRGAAGVDEQSVEQFEEHLKGNLYKLWNRLSSGSYFPPPVKRVDIAKRDGGTRPLGIPTVADRIAQAVVKAYLEPALEQHFQRRLLRLSTEEVGVGCGRRRPQALLALGVGPRPRHPRLLRHDSARSVTQGGEGTHRLRLGAVVHRAVADGSRPDGRRHLGTSGEGDAARVSGFTIARESLLALRV